MRILTLSVALMAACSPNRVVPTDAAKRRIEAPIKESISWMAPEKYDLSKTGIDWHKGLDAVRGKGKPILLLQILGSYDEVFC